MNKQNIVVTGAGGTLCSVIAVDFAKQGHNVVLVGRSLDKLQKVEDEIRSFGGSCVCITADVKDEARMMQVREEVHKVYGPVTILINGAGGNQPDAVTTINEFDPKELTDDREGLRGFFNLDMKKFLDVIEINTLGTVIPSRVFALDMIEQGHGNIINFASMNTYRPLSRVPAYAIAKAGVSNFTQWLATHFAGTGIRCNAIAPGFIVSAQNKALLFNADGTPTARSGKILNGTPMGRFAESEELLGGMFFLTDDKAASAVTGVILPIDCGFAAYSGV